MARSEILYRFTVGKPLKLPENYFAPREYGSPEELKTILLSDYYDTEGNSSYIFTEHQIKFTIRMSDKPSPNIGNVTLFNLDDQLINYLRSNSGNNLVCILEAGDNEQGLKQIYKGTISKVDIQDNDTDNFAKMTITDGGLNVKSAYSVRGYPKGTPYKTVVSDLAGDLKLPLGTLEGVGGVTPSPLNLMGGTHSILERQLLLQGIDYSIQNSVINILPQFYRKAQEVSVITAKSGLIGRITPIVNDSATTNTTLSSDSESVGFRCLLDGSLNPTETVYLQDREYDGAFKLTSVSFLGDKEGNLWICECIAKPTQGVLDSSNPTNNTIKIPLR